MRIEVISLTAAGSDGIAVGFRLSDGENSCKESLIISIDVYTQLDIQRGECPRELYEKVESEASIFEAYRRGINVLGFGFCSRKMLVSKLRQKGYSMDIAEEAVKRIEAKDYLDEGENSLREAEKCVAKLWGEARIKGALAEKRYSVEAINAALYALEDSGVDYDANCKELIDKKYKVLPTDRVQMQKLVAAVCRYGYSVAQIKRACIKLSEERKIKDMFG